MVKQHILDITSKNVQLTSLTYHYHESPKMTSLPCLITMEKSATKPGPADKSPLLTTTNHKNHGSDVRLQRSKPCEGQDTNPRKSDRSWGWVNFVRRPESDGGFLSWLTVG